MVEIVSPVPLKPSLDYLYRGDTLDIKTIFLYQLREYYLLRQTRGQRYVTSLSAIPGLVKFNAENISVVSVELQSNHSETPNHMIGFAKIIASPSLTIYRFLDPALGEFEFARLSTLESFFNTYLEIQGYFSLFTSFCIRNLDTVLPLIQKETSDLHELNSDVFTAFQQRVFDSQAYPILENSNTPLPPITFRNLPSTPRIPHISQPASPKLTT